MISWFKNIQERFGMKPYLEISNPDRFINQNYFQHKDLDIFFFSNSNANESREITVRFTSNGKLPWLWDAETGKRSLLQDNSSDSLLKLHFERAESKLIVFEIPKGRDSEQSISKSGIQSPENGDSVDSTILEGPWTLILEHVDGRTESIELSQLLDFLDDSRLKTFAGIVHYKKTLEISENVKYSAIDLGKVVGISEVLINNKSLGIRWYGDHTYVLEDNLHAGENELRIKVTTVLGNYLKSLEDNPVAQRWISWQEYKSQGLLGPVKLI